MYIDIIRLYWVNYFGHGILYYTKREHAERNFQDIINKSEQPDPEIEMGYFDIPLSNNRKELTELICDLAQFGDMALLKYYSENKVLKEYPEGRE